MLNTIVPKNEKKKVKIFKELPVFKPVAGHFSLAPFLITSEMFEGLDFEIAGKDISGMIGESVADLHVHSHPEIYLLVSSKPGEAEIEIETREDTFKMTSPCAAYIPANMEHRFVVRKASPGSFCFGILLSSQEKSTKSVDEIFSSGITCNALLVLEETGILKILNDENGLFEDDERIQLLNALVIHTSLKSLVRSGILQKRSENERTFYSFTELGKQASENVGSLVLWHEGYRNLLANQVQIASSKHPIDEESTDGAVVARSSALLGRKYVDAEVIHFINQIKPRGRICDLGCGDGSRLIRICKMTQTAGIGLDFSEGAIQEALKQPQSPELHVKFQKADVLKMKGSMPEVDVFMQAFLSHHILPDSVCCEIFRQYKEIFPNARYFLLLDTVDEEQTQFESDFFYPGFEYIHSLRGVKPRSYSEMINILKEAGYMIEKEVKLKISNCYLWGLKINRRIANE